ncbi:MAG: hypothetical protein NVS2B16_28680 [Chloroflexota bacterium]
MGIRGISRTRRFIWPVVALVLLVGGVGIALFAFAGAPTTADRRAVQRGENYGRQEVVWSQGPSIESEKVISLNQLSSTLASMVPTTTQQNVAAMPLARRYGARRRVAVVVLRGTYNSLPPDEGVAVTGDVLVLVDVKTDHVLLMTS